MPRITIKDIAKAAGVSRGTVDRALNNRGNIDQAKREVILRLAKEIGYTKNINASSLASNKVRRVAIILPDDRDPYWALPLRVVEQQAALIHDYGFEFLYFLFNAEDAVTYTEALSSALAVDADAFILAPIFYKESLKFLQPAAHNGVPVITLNTEIHHSGVTTYIGQDSFQAGLLTGKLFSLLHPDIATILAITVGGHRSNAKHIDDKISGLQTFFEQQSMKTQVLEIYIDDQAPTEEIRKTIYDQLKKDGQLGLWFTNSRTYTGMKSFDPHELESNAIIGFDLVGENVQLLKNQSINFLLNQKPDVQAEMAMKCLMELFVQSKSLPKRRILPIDIVVAENVDGYLNH